VSAVNHKPRLAIVSPFLDNSHGTERLIIKWVSQLNRTFEIHVYSQRIEDLDLSKITWHRISKIPGPHLFNFLWWFVANRLHREWDRQFCGLRYDLIFSPGPNCLDADAITVHIVFAEYLRKIQSEGGRSRQTVWSYLRRLHRRLYYRLIVSLERRTYTRPDITLIVTAQRTAAALEEHYGRRGHWPVVYTGLDHECFNPARRRALRERAREELRLREEEFTLLLIGNDWRNKGVPVLLEALERLRELPVSLAVVSREDPADAWRLITSKGLEDRVRFLTPRKDVEFYYAAADAYVGASLEDAFALPPAEAMACGLPVIVSASAGASEIVTNGEDGLILKDPTDFSALAAMIRRLYEDRGLRDAMGARAAETTRQYTWERNGRELAAIFEEILRRKTGFAAQTLTQEL
jgi:UDP-glucose:(heptosyl)LPS alpha-1,3-glucosyltransferase